MSKRLKVAILAASAILAVVALTMGAMRFYHYWEDLQQRASANARPVEVRAAEVPIPEAVSPPKHQRVLPEGEAQFSFVSLAQQTFVLNPGEARYLSIGPGKLTDRVLHVHFASRSPVDMGILATFVVQRPNVNLGNLGNVSLCHQPRITSIDFDCVIPGNRQTDGLDLSFVLHDSRSAGGMAASLGAAMLGSKTALNNESVRNDVELVLSVRQCVAFCRPKDE